MVWKVKIIEKATGEICENMTCDSESDAYQIRSGAMINGNTKDFSFMVVQERPTKLKYFLADQALILVTL